MAQSFVEFTLAGSFVLLCLVAVGVPIGARIGYANTHRRWSHAGLLWFLFALSFLATMIGAALECAVALINSLRPDLLSAGDPRYGILTMVALSLLFGGIFLAVVTGTLMLREQRFVQIAGTAGTEALQQREGRTDRNGLNGREIMTVTLGTSILFFFGIGVLSSAWVYAALYAGIMLGIGVLLTAATTVLTSRRR